MEEENEQQIGAATSLRRAERAVRGELPEETVLLNVDSGKAVRLNATAAWCWEQLAEPRSVDALATGLAEEFGVGLGQALADVQDFAADLLGRSLLEIDSR